MTTKAVPGQLLACNDPNDLAEETALRLSRALRQAITKTGRAALALSGGATPRDAYARLAREPGVDWSKIDVFWVDERAVPPTDDRSNYRWAKATLLDAAGVAPERVHRMRAEEPERESVARQYEALVRSRVPVNGDGVPAIDVAVLGIGEDGHTASLFPGAREVDITDRLVAAVPASGNREARLTLTVPAIEHVKHVFVVAVGAGKRPALERVWSSQGDIHDTPARVVRGCRGGVTWLIDKAAGGLAG